MSDELLTFVCKESFKDIQDEEFNTVIKKLSALMVKYEDFTEKLEMFFNNQADEEDMTNFPEGKVFELSAPDSRISFPFVKKDGKLMFLDQDAWRAMIMAAIVIEMTEKKKEKYEQNKLQLIPPFDPREESGR